MGVFLLSSIIVNVILIVTIIYLVNNKPEPEVIRKKITRYVEGPVREIIKEVPVEVIVEKQIIKEVVREIEVPIEKVVYKDKPKEIKKTSSKKEELLTELKLLKGKKKKSKKDLNNIHLIESILPNIK